VAFKGASGFEMVKASGANYECNLDVVDVELEYYQTWTEALLVSGRLHGCRVIDRHS